MKAAKNADMAQAQAPGGFARQENTGIEPALPVSGPRRWNTDHEGAFLVEPQRSRQVGEAIGEGLGQ
jgi:hypothetical protein